MGNGVPITAMRHRHPATFGGCFLNTRTGISCIVFPLGEEGFNAHFFLDFIFFYYVFTTVLTVTRTLMGSDVTLFILCTRKT